MVRSDQTWPPRRMDFVDTIPTDYSELDSKPAPEPESSFIGRFFNSLTPGQFWFGYGVLVGVCIAAMVAALVR